MNRLTALDSLRGLAALTVVFYHYLFRYDEIYGHQFNVSWMEFGHFGVQLFFIVSGFVISWSLSRSNNPFDFIVSRFARLFPAYWIAVLLTFLTVLLFGLEGREVGLSDMFFNLTMLQEFVGVPHVDGVYWTLTAELLFYFWIFLIYIADNFKRVELFFVPFIMLSSLYHLDLLTLPSFIINLFLLKHIAFFTAGICFYKLQSRDTSNSFNTSAVLFLSIAAGFITFGLEHVFEVFVIFALFYLAVNNKLHVLSSKTLISLGGMSYSLYLIHQNIGYIVINQFRLFSESLVFITLGITVALSVSLILAYLITRFIEQPINKGIKHAYTRLKNRQLSIN